MAGIDWEQARLRLKAIETALERALEGTPEQIGKIFQERARRLAEPARAPVSGGVPVLVFRLGEERYAVDLADTGGVLRHVCCTPVPEASPSLEGVLNVDGEIRPALNLRFLLGLPAAKDDDFYGHILLLRKNGREMAVRVDRVERMQSISSPQAPLNAAGNRARYVQGFTPDSVTLLSTHALFSEFWGKEFES